jgi:hypothetical protein
VTIAYRKRMEDSPAYRLNHEEIAEGPRGGHPLRGEPLARRGAEGRARRAPGDDVQAHADGSERSSYRRAPCVHRRGHPPNVTYEREKPRSFSLDKKGFFEHAPAVRRDDGSIALEKSAGDAAGPTGLLHELPRRGGHTVSFYGDNHPIYAGSVVRAMASGKDGHQAIAALFAPDIERALASRDEAARDAQWAALSARLRDDVRATVVHEVNRLTQDDRGGRGARARAGARLQAGAVLPPPEFREHGARGRGHEPPHGGPRADRRVDRPEKGLLSMIVLEMGASSRSRASLRWASPSW